MFNLLFFCLRKSLRYALFADVPGNRYSSESEPPACCPLPFIFWRPWQCLHSLGTLQASCKCLTYYSLFWFFCFVHLVIVVQWCWCIWQHNFMFRWGVTRMKCVNRCYTNLQSAVNCSCYESKNGVWKWNYIKKNFMGTVNLYLLTVLELLVNGCVSCCSCGSSS